MRAVVQRVSEASVSIEGNVKGSIGKGFMVLLGVEDIDEQADLDVHGGLRIVALGLLHAWTFGAGAFALFSIFKIAFAGTN